MTGSGSGNKHQEVGGKRTFAQGNNTTKNHNQRSVK